MLPSRRMASREIMVTRWWRTFSAALALGAIACWFVPLVRAAGYELSALYSVPAAVLGACCGIAAARRTGAHPLAVFAGAAPAAVLPLVAPLLLALLPGFLRIDGPLPARNCEPGLSAAFWGWMPVSSALFSCALGVVLGRATRRAGLLFAAILLASLAGYVLDIADGPEMFGGNHFFGWFEGGVYEEVLTLDPALPYLRLLSALFALTLLLLAGLVLPYEDDTGLHLYGMERWQGAMLAVVAVAFAIAFSQRKDFRIDLTREDVRRELGGHFATEHFDLWYQKGTMDEAKLALVAADHEYRLARVVEYLGVSPRGRISSYVFPNNEAKRRFTGSAETQVANIDHREIYVTDYGYPHPVIEHELAHIVSGEICGIFGLPWNGLVPNVAFLEGIAVAAAWHDRGSGTPHEQSAAMLKEKLLPSAEKIAGLGFWTDRQARAYTAAGSFLRFLGDTYGVEKVREAYRHTSVEEAFGKDLGALEVEWRRFLETVPVEEKKRAAAQERFTQPSIFEQTCARELARLEHDTWNAPTAKDAVAIAEEWRKVDDRSAPLRALAEMKKRDGDLEGALESARARLAREVPRSPGAWWARADAGDLLLLSGRAEEAEKEYRAILEAAATPDLVRHAWFRLRAVELRSATRPSERALANGIEEYLVPPPKTRASIVPLVTIATAATIDGTPHAALGAYLIGRALLSQHDPAHALPWLEAAVRGQDVLGPVAVRAEALALRADALTRLGRLDEADAGWKALAALEGAPGEVRDRAQDGAARVAWLRGASKAELDARSRHP